MTGPSPILFTAQKRAADRAAVAAGVTEATLMRRAGEAAAAAIIARFAPQPTLVLCGPGGNGGDGCVVARRLAQAGWPVTVGRGARAEPTSAAAEHARAWTGPMRPLSAGCEGATLVVDALFGAGLARPLTAEIARTLHAVQASGAAVAAIDVPTGVNADTGRAQPATLRAALTVTFGALSPAHVLQPARGLCGDVVVADIGLAPPAGGALHENTPALWEDRFPWPATDAHKMQRGRLIVVGGDPRSTGASRLSARAGLRIGAGLVTLCCPEDALAIYAATLEAVMVRPFETDAELLDLAEDSDACIIGPGAGVDEETAANLLALAQTGAALVVDADALTVFRDDAESLFSALDRDDVLTPHPGEFERIFPGLLHKAPDRIAAAREASKRAGAVLLLKGADTVIAAPDGRAAVNTNAAPWLATAGSGDVLAGFIGGLLAQGMDSFEAACAAAWIHAEAGRDFGPGLISEDLPQLAPPVLRRLLSTVPQPAPQTAGVRKPRSDRPDRRDG